MDTFQFFQGDSVILTSDIKEMIERTCYHKELLDYAMTTDAPSSLPQDGPEWPKTVEKHTELAGAIKNLHATCSDRALDLLPLSQSICRDMWRITVAVHDLKIDAGVREFDLEKKAKWNQYLANIAQAFLRLIPLEFRLEINSPKNESELHAYTITVTEPRDGSMIAKSEQREDGSLTGAEEIYALGASLVERGYTQCGWTLQTHVIRERKMTSLDQGIRRIAELYDPDRRDLAAISMVDEHDDNLARLLREVASKIEEMEMGRSQHSERTLGFSGESGTA